MHQSQHPLPAGMGPTAPEPGKLSSPLRTGTGRSRRRAGAGLGWPQQLLEQSRCWELTPGLGGSAPTAAATEQLSLPSRGTGNVQQIPLKKKKSYKTIWVINKKSHVVTVGSCCPSQGLGRSQEPAPARGGSYCLCAPSWKRASSEIPYCSRGSFPVIFWISFR